VADDLPEDVRALLLASIDSVMELEALLLLHRTAPAAWDAARIAADLRIQVRASADRLAALAERGLLRADPAADPLRYRYEPASEALGLAVDGLAQAYTERRVSVVQFIYAKPADKIRVFADAFRLRRDDSDG
jgi:hypothetical protein